MSAMLSTMDHRLLDDWQRDLPLVPRPFAAMAETLGTDEATVLDRLHYLVASGTVARVGATCRPNTVGASTLAALAVPEDRLEEVAAVISAEEGVNHSYLRENALNLWFVATAPDRDDLRTMLARIEDLTGLEVLNLPLVRAFNIDLGFRLSGPRHAMPEMQHADEGVLRAGDRPLLQTLSEGLPLVPEPWSEVASRLGQSTSEVTGRIAALTRARIIGRLGIIVRHRALGWRSNAMVVWDLPEARIEAAGNALVRLPGVTLCYQRVRVPGRWDYPLFSMIHGRDRGEALGVLDGARSLPELAGAAHQALFSLRCFKQTGALVHRRVG